MDGALALACDMPESDSPHLAPVPDSPGEVTPRQIVEALLFATDTPLPAARLAQILGVGDARDVRAHVAALNEAYEQSGAAFRIEEIAGGFQMLTRPVFNTWLARLLRARQESKLSAAALESLAVIAYRQPVARADIESVRGVACGDVLNRLRELNLVKIVGRAEDLGRPLLYGTTKHFLEVFGLGSIEDLPKVEALRAPSPPAVSPAGDTPVAEPANESPAEPPAESPSDDVAPTE